ncbi:hypothetical protein CBR_g41066 [Chara braunii]|uniref:Uncharacterized protein n=1 Tax=Chara braunii TaxID=69332 RepID=A0A388LVD1_CHABU|nr:hypothetical protein CBR_g41066 [Chara braunii]|eukprot:GBG86162.1 hypothetical protein CBR_g41066 [Chara braunii]
MTNMAFRLGKVHALGDVVVLDVSTYDTLLGLPVLTALRANLDFERRSIVLQNTGGKPFAIPMRLTLRTVAEVTQKTPPMPGGTLRMIAWKKLAERSNHRTEEPNLSSDTDNSDENELVIRELVQQHVRYLIRQATTKTFKLMEGNIQRTRALILGEPLVQISRMIDSLEPLWTLYEGTTPLLARYRDKRAFCDITELPRSLLTLGKEIRLLRLGVEDEALEPPARCDTGPHNLGIKIAKKPVRWQDVCDGITPEEHVAIREENPQMMVTVFSSRSDNSFIFVPPPGNIGEIDTKQITIQILGQPYELHVPHYVPNEIHHLIAEILKEYQGAISVTDMDIGLSLWRQAYVALSFCLLEIAFHWAEPADRSAEDEISDDEVELLLVQGWRTDAEGDFLGILFKEVCDDHPSSITDEMLVFLTQVLDHLPLEILSHCDEILGTAALTRTLEPHPLWSTCTELEGNGYYLPSRGAYLPVVVDVTDLSTWDPLIRCIPIGETSEEAEEEEEESEEGGHLQYTEGETTPEEDGSGAESDDPDYWESEDAESEEASSDRVESGEEEAGSGGSSGPDELSRREREVVAQRVWAAAEGKRPIEESGGPPPQLLQDDPARNPEPRREEDEQNDTTAEGSRSWRH